MTGPPTSLLRLTNFLGGEPRWIYARRTYWLLVLVGMFEIATAVGLFAVSHTQDVLLIGPMILTVGIFFIVQGAEGLLRETHSELSLWCRVIQMLFAVPLVLFWAAQWYAWWGFLGVAACVVVVGAIFVLTRLVESNR